MYFTRWASWWTDALVASSVVIVADLVHRRVPHRRRGMFRLVFQRRGEITPGADGVHAGSSGLRASAARNPTT